MNILRDIDQLWPEFQRNSKAIHFILYLDHPRIAEAIRVMTLQSYA